MIIRRMMAGVYAANCYILLDENTKDVVVLDPGGDVDDICNAVNDFHGKVKYIILTHGHFDHTTGVEELKDITGAQVAISKEDNDMIMKGEQYYGPFPEAGGDILLKDGDELKFGNTTLKILATPGHTPGGICILSDDDVFTGDTLFAGSVGRSDLKGGNQEALIRSIKEKLMVLDNTIAVHPGHGASSTIGKERNDNPFI